MLWTEEQAALLEGAGATLLNVADGQEIADLIWQAHPWAGILDPLVLLDENTSDFPALVRAGPIAGYVVHFRHDEGPVVLCRSIDAYLDAVRATGELPHDSLLDPDGERTEREEMAAQHLAANAFDDDDWGALELAIPLIRENIGLLIAMARQSDTVRDLAERRLRRVTSPDQKRAMAQGDVPAPWPLPEEMIPTVVYELPLGWSRTQADFTDTVIAGCVRIERDGETRTLVLSGEVDLTGFLDQRLPVGPEGIGFMGLLGSWGEGQPVAELCWLGPEHIRLTVGEDRVVDWTRD